MNTRPSSNTSGWATFTGEAGQWPGHAKGVAAAIGDGRVGPGSVTAHRLVEQGIIGVRPPFLAGVGVVADHGLVTGDLLQRNGRWADDGDAGVPAADR